MPQLVAEPITINLFGKAMQLRCFAAGAMYQSLKRGLAWEGHLGGQLFPNLKDHTVFFDLGANVGYYSILASARLTAGKVVAVEPNPEILPVLRGNVALNRADNIVVEPVALGARRGTVNVTFDATEPGASHISETGASVQMVTLDDLTARHGAPDYIKIDVEGFEGDIIHGGMRTFETTSTYAFMEFSPSAFERSQHPLDEMLLWLASIGYQFRFFRGHTQTATEPITAELLVGLARYWNQIGHGGHMDIVVGRDMHPT